MRIFTFGCSFSNWLWPTWPDIIKSSYPDIKVQNWALYGTSNVSIYHRLLQCDLINNFTDKDIIIVGWTTWSRSHIFRNNTWDNEGNYFNPLSNIPIDDIWCPEDDVIKNSFAIIAANKLFNISYQFDVQTSLDEKYQTYINLANYSNNIVTNSDSEKYKANINFCFDKLKALDVFPSTGPAFDLTNDYHPDIKKQVDWSIHIANNTKLNISDDVIDYYYKLHDMYVADLVKTNTKKFTFEQRKHYFKQYYEYREIY